MKTKLPLLIIILLLFCFKSTQAQLSKKHFIPPLTYAESGNANPENQYFYISTPSTKDVSYTIKQIGSPSNDITGIVSANNSQEIFIASGDSQLFVNASETGNVHNNKGFIVEATDVIYVSIRVLAGGGNQAGALVSKGTSALGTTFRAGMFTNENPQSNYLNFISVMASEDDTQVTFDDLPSGIEIFAPTTSFPISVDLNEGESFIVATSADDVIINRDGLIGTLINSDKPIAVNVGSANGSFHNGNGRDYGIDQIVGLDKIGTEYIFVKGDGSDGWENILIVAHEDDTTVSLNGNGVNTTINKGEYKLIEGNQFNPDGNLFVKTSKPTFAYQGIGANGNEANQGMFFVPPLSCENRGKVDNIPNIDNIGSVTFTGGVTIVTNINATVNINSQPIENFSNLSGPFEIDINNDGSADYKTYKVKDLEGDVSIDSSEELYCAYFNANGVATSGSFYSGFPSAPEINFDTTVTSLGNCIPNVTLEAANTDLFDSVKWEYYNEITSIWEERSINDTYQPIASEPGRYRLIGKIDCTNTTFESAEIPVSICPDDYDGDLIIDNLDIDIDNDGILNCDESLGDIPINLSDTNNAITLNPLTNTNIIDNSNFTSAEVTNTISGDNLGNFTSTINPAVDSKLQYELNFTQNINFKFTQNKATDHVISEGEFFILKIGPSNKNLTLLDPDDQLLIDSNFDGEFETGITNISASEIHFKFKTNLSGAASTFEFLANQVNQIDFKHESTGLSTVSTFDGNIQLTCFTLDSDGDGIENMFDLDSDNDGIPDFQESTAQNVALLNTDTNLDGLDDIFNTVISNKDTDNDRVPNYLDVDSDNDGIYDLVESRNTGIDANNDGILDDANSTNVGLNGLLNSLETSADNNILSYTISDTDADNLFNFVELDSDNDNCFDVFEAGFTDINDDGVLDARPFAIDINGKVINSTDGYTDPNLDYINSAPIIINNFVNITFCENDTDIITIDSTADNFQWEVSTDGSTWNSISDNSIYTNSTTASLQIINVPLSYNNNQYRVILNRTGNACTTTSNAITLTVNPKPILINNLVELKQCADNPSRNKIVNLTEAEKNISTDTNITFEYYRNDADAIEGDTSKQISDKEHYTVTSGLANAWARVISNTTGCFDICEINITASFVTDITINTPFEECDDLIDEDGNNSENDGITTFDFSSAEQQIKNSPSFSDPSIIEVFFYETAEDRDAAINPIQNISNHRNKDYAHNQTIYIKIKNKENNDCEGIGRLFLKTNPTPTFTVEGEAPNTPIIICTKNIPYTLKVENPADIYDYKWTEKSGIPIPIDDGESISIDKAGEYTVTAFSRNTTRCSRTRTIVVQKSDFGTLDESFVLINDDISTPSSNLSITINIPTNPLINEVFQYALEDENGNEIRSLQDSNVFTNIEGGIYNLIVENKGACGRSELLISVIQLPKFFTPNADGLNDTYVIKGVSRDFYSGASINIFNRYGKLVAQETIDSQGWNGLYNGKLLPADDYWFNITLIPTDNTKPAINKKGHFSLIR